MNTFKGHAFLILLIWNGVVGLALATPNMVGGLLGVKLKVEKVNLLNHIYNSNESGPGLPDFDSADVYPQLKFEPGWVSSRQRYWKSEDFNFEERYKREQMCPSNSSLKSSSSCHLPPLEVFVLPFSHNDPGWFKTFQGYFDSKTKFILNNAMEKLPQFPEMTFVWSEICYLAKWWDDVANSTQKGILKRLVEQGRFEILTGGWVMPDEASPTFFALSQQLVEGREWLRNHLGHKPRAAWAIDPFGHGSVMPYILRGSGFKGMLIQRLHYGWKHWLAEHKYGNFLWNQRWDKTGENAIHCLNAPYDQYPTTRSCGPMDEVCTQFSFGDESFHPVTNQNVQRLADDLMGQYRRTASLTRHNVVVAGVGMDFEFSERIEWDQRYSNYMKLFRFINSHPERYNAKVGFGTLSQYFEAVEKKHPILPNFHGDFFPYSLSGFEHNSYWTGYYSTRPFWKGLSRRVEDELRKAEILFTFTFAYLKQLGAEEVIHGEDNLSKVFKSLVEARQFLALFQHHDGITGTSPRGTMLDSKDKLNTAIRSSERVQGTCLNMLMGMGKRLLPSGGGDGTLFSVAHMDIDIPLVIQGNGMGKNLVIFNSVGWSRWHLVKLLVDTSDLAVYGPSGQPITSQINPYLTPDGKSSSHYELAFVAHLGPFTIQTYELKKITRIPFKMTKYRATQASSRTIPSLANTSLTLENEHLKVTLDGGSGLLKEVLRKDEMISAKVEMRFGKYKSKWGAGAYTSWPIMEDPTDTLASCRNTNGPSIKLLMVSGPVTQEVRVICGWMTISYQILLQGSPEAQSGLHVTNWIRPEEHEGEFFMSFQTDLETRSRTPESPTQEPTFFTDTGLGVERRKKVSILPYEGNLYPVVNYAFIQDPLKRRRLSLLVDRSHGVTSTKSGHLEVIIDRRILSADGIGEGVTDPEPILSKYVILLESLPPTPGDDQTQLWKPTLAVQRASKMLNYRPSAFVCNNCGDDAATPEGSTSPTPPISLFTKEFPNDAFLLNLRTTTMTNATHETIPGRTALLTIQNLGHLEETGAPTPVHQGLGSDLVINHFCIPTDLVGDPTWEGEAYPDHAQFNLTTTGMLNISQPFEVNSFLVHFETD